jgi:hypothetical protein
MQERTRWLVLAGILLLAGVVVWRLTAGSYKTDLRKICDAEKASGADPHDVQRAEAWAKDHAETPEASAWLTELLKKGMSERAKTLKDEAQKYGIASCPLATTYERMRLEGEYRADLLAMCTSMDVGVVELGDDDERLRLMLEWINAKAKSTRTKALADDLAKADAKARPGILRDAASGMSVYQCELVATLLKPQAKPRKDEPSIELGSPQINGDMAADKVIAAFLTKEPVLRACYDTGLAKNANLAGRMMVKVGVSPSGKTIRAGTEKGTTLADGDVAKCALKAVSEIVFPPTGSPIVSIMLPLDFIPKKAPPPMPADPHQH